ncbi:NAD-binding protein [Halobium palmae]|uniref:NAD-binding protein n=1 Tax=Halobium palmae TaxID=1776492 RepID=A0ABD5RW01_9EURY
MKSDARQLDRSDPHSEELEAEYYVLGGGDVGACVARQLYESGQVVNLIDESNDCPTTPGAQGDPTDLRTLRNAGIPKDSTIVVATRSDKQNLLIGQLVRAHFDVGRVVVLVNDRDRFEVFAAANHEPVCATTALSDALVESV